VAEMRGDQAAGLRRLFAARRSVQFVSFVAGSVGVGRSTLLANLATCLARRGKEVLLVDENSGDDLLAYFGRQASCDLLQAIDGQKAIDDVLVGVAPGVRVLPAALLVRQLARLAAGEQQRLIDCLRAMTPAADVVLIDTSLDHPLGFSPLGLATRETIIVVSTSGQSITEAYALIKRVSLGYARRSFRILVTKARTADEAQAIHANMARLTHSRRIAQIEYAGHVPNDEHLRLAARLCQPVTALFPEAPAAKASHCLAASLLDWQNDDEVAGGMDDFVQQLVHLSQRIDPIAIYA